MSNTKISALTAAIAALSTDELPINEAGLSKKLTVGQIQAYTFGSSFPAQPAYGTNVPFFRTDLGQWHYYDGTRWNGPQLRLTLVCDGGLPIGSTTTWRVALPRYAAGIAAYFNITDIEMSSYVITTNDTTNYWYGTPHAAGPSGASSALCQITTYGLAIGEWGRGPIFNTSLPFRVDLSAYVEIDVALAENGTPGSAYHTIVVVGNIQTT